VTQSSLPSEAIPRLLDPPCHELHRGRLEAPRHVVAVQPRHPVGTEVLAHVLGEVARAGPGLLEPPGPDGEVPQELDVDEPLSPRRIDQAPLDVAAHGEVPVQAVTARMPLGHPQVRERIAEPTLQPPEERREVRAERRRLEASRPA